MGRAFSQVSEYWADCCQRISREREEGASILIHIFSDSKYQALPLGNRVKLFLKVRGV